MDKLISFCGDRCDLCPRFTSKTDAELLTVAELWHKVGWRDGIMTSEETRCDGCNIEKSCGYGITECLRGKGLDKCAECGLFPCEKIRIMLDKSAKSQALCRTKCSDDEYDTLSRAFFEKEQNLRFFT